MNDLPAAIYCVQPAAAATSQSEPSTTTQVRAVGAVFQSGVMSALCADGTEPATMSGRPHVFPVLRCWHPASFTARCGPCITMPCHPTVPYWPALPVAQPQSSAAAAASQPQPSAATAASQPQPSSPSAAIKVLAAVIA